MCKRAPHRRALHKQGTLLTIGNRDDETGEAKVGRVLQLLGAYHSDLQSSKQERIICPKPHDTKQTVNSVGLEPRLGSQSSSCCCSTRAERRSYLVGCDTRKAHEDCFNYTALLSMKNAEIQSNVFRVVLDNRKEHFRQRA